MIGRTGPIALLVLILAGITVPAASAQVNDAENIIPFGQLAVAYRQLSKSELSQAVFVLTRADYGGKIPSSAAGQSNSKLAPSSNDSGTSSHVMTFPTQPTALPRHH